MSEELLYNQLYDRTKDFGRTQFIKEIMRLERENKQLEESEHNATTTMVLLNEENKQLKEQLAKQPQIFVDTDIEERYGYGLENDYLREQLKQKDEVIEEIKSIFEQLDSNQICEIVTDIANKTLDILNKYKGDSNG